MYLNSVVSDFSKRVILPFLLGILWVICFAIPSFAQTDVRKLVDLSNNLHTGRLRIAGDTIWKKIEIGSNMNQSSFSNNWTGGGVASTGIGVFLNSTYVYKRSGNSWRNDLNMQYGFSKNKDQGSRKSLDRIFFDSKYSRDLNSKWVVFVNLNFQSQFSSGYDYTQMIVSDSIKTGPKRVSGMFSPAYFVQSLGIEYKPTDYFYVDLAPGAFRQTIVWDRNLYMNTPDQKNYGVPIGKRIKYELALLQLVANYNRNITTKINLKSRYQLYSSLLDPLKMDHRLDATITAQVHKYVNVNVNMIVTYDDDQDSNIQFAQGLNLGFQYTF